MKKSLFTPLGLVAGALLSVTASAGPKTIQDGVYTEDQAESGKAVFDQYCKACHVKEFYQAKFAMWKGQPLSALYDSMSASMPEDNPGGLYLQEYTDVMAYIFSLMEYPAGEKPLDHSDGSMDEIVIQAD